MLNHDVSRGFCTQMSCASTPAEKKYIIWQIQPETPHMDVEVVHSSLTTGALLLNFKLQYHYLACS